MTEIMTDSIANVLIRVNTKEPESKLQKLEEKAARLRKQFTEAFKKGDTEGIDKINKELNRTNRDIDKLKTRVESIRAAMERLDQASPKDLKNTIKLLNAEMNSGRVKRGTKEWNDYVAALKRVQNELSRVRAEMNATSDNRGFFRKMSDGFNQWGASAAAAAAAFAGVVMSGKSAVQAYADMEQEEANVRKFTGMTAEQVAELNEEFKKMDTRTSREDLNKLAQEAGRLGKASKEDVLGFVRAADQINVALDELGEGATLTLSKLTGIFGDEAVYGTEQSLLKVGSVINELSQNCSASAPYLTEFSARLGGVAKQANMTISQVMAFGAVLDSNQLQVEAASTAVQQLISKIYLEPEKFAKVAGIEVSKFTEMVKTDMNGALIELLEHLNKFGGMENLAKVFNDLGVDGARAQPVITALANHIEELKSQQEAANKAFREGTSISKEFAVQNDTVQAQLDKAKKGFTEMAVSLGQQLLPVMRYCISGTSLLMRVLSVLITFITKNKTAIIALATAIGTYIIAIKAAVIQQTAMNVVHKASIALNGLLRTSMIACNAVLNLLTLNAKGASVAWRALNITMKANPIGLVISAISAGIAVLTSWISKTNETKKAERELAEQRAKEMADFRKGITALADKSSKYAEEELVNLKKLYKGATDETKAKEERIKAAKELQSLYPDYFSKLSTEQLMIGQGITMYENLTKSILKSARARAAYDKIKENEGKKIDLEMEIEDLRNERAEMDEQMKGIAEEIRFQQWRITKRHDGAGEKKRALLGQYETVRGKAAENKQQQGLKATQRKEIDEVNKRLEKIAGDYVPEKTEEVIPGTAPTPYVSSEKAEKEAKKAEAQQRKAAAAAKRILQESLKEQKTVRDQALAENQEAYNKDEISYDEYMGRKDSLNLEYFSKAKAVLEKKGLTETDMYADLCKKEEELRGASLKRLERQQLSAIRIADKKAQAANLANYSQGVINYQTYLNEKERLDREFIENQLKAFEDAGQKETEQYAKLLEQREKLNAESKKRRQEIDARDVDGFHKGMESGLTEKFYDPSSVMFRNEKALNQALLQETVRFLREKQALYLEGSEEWVDIERQLEETLNKDKLDKQKELAEAYAQYQEKYAKLSAEERKKTEFEMLKQVHEAGLISQEQYEKAVSALKRECRKEDLDEAKKTESEYASMLTGLYQSFKNFFAAVKEGGGNFWGDLADMAEATFTVIGAGLAQYSAYANAERDLELAKIEKRYEKEIAAAGKNQKKKEKLEKQKEAEIAKVKNKYNEKAQKIEIAQAVAQTAVAAINAYASASEENWLLGPIAAAMATAAGMMQVATIKKQHEAQAAGYYQGGFTDRDPDSRKEVGVVHANEFVANAEAVRNPALAPLLRLIDHAQRNNTVGSLTPADVSNALGQGKGVSARGEAADGSRTGRVLAGIVATMAETNTAVRESLDRLSTNLEDGIDANVTMDGEQGLDKKTKRYEKLINAAKR